MDPALRELLRRGSDDDEIEVVIRFAEGAIAIPPRLRIVSRFGNIATARLRRMDIPGVRDHASIASLKAPRLIGPEHTVNLPLGTAPSTRDRRRPPDVDARGTGVVIGILDWGMDFARDDFRNRDGSTRLLAIWDQRERHHRGDNDPYGYGRILSRDAINEALSSRDPYRALGYHPADADPYGVGAHGTVVADIAAGNGRSGGPEGVAPDANLVFVHLASRGTAGLATLGDSVSIIEGLDLIRRLAGDRAIAVSMSLGRHGGPHDGTTLVELAIDQFLAERPGRFLAQSCGNYALKQAHASGELRPGEVFELPLLIDFADPTVNEVEIWHDNETCAVTLQAPHGGASEWAVAGEASELVHDGNLEARVYHRRRDPQNGSHHVDIFIYPGAPAGMWRIALHDRRASGVAQAFHAWIERDDACLQCQSRFPAAAAEQSYTLGTLAGSRGDAVVVAAYDAHEHRLVPAAFSSLGPTRDGRRKPDIAAPGVGVIALRSATAATGHAFEPLTRRSGTSMATPHVAGCAALMLEVTSGRLSARQLRTIVLETADASSHADRLGAGYLNIGAAVDSARRHTPKAVQRTHFNQETIPMVNEESSPAAAIANPDALYRQLNSSVAGRDGFEVIGRPRQVLEHPLRTGDILLRVALGEPGLGHAAVLLDDRLLTHDEVLLEGVTPEAHLAGRFAIVANRDAAGAGSTPRYARMITTPDGVVADGQMVLRFSPPAALSDDVSWDAMGEGIDEADIVALVEEWRAFFGKADDQIGKTIEQVRDFFSKSLQRLKNAADTRQLLQAMAVEAREHPVRGLTYFLLYLPIAFTRDPSRFWKLLTTDVLADENWSTLVLPEPGTLRDPTDPAAGTHKYLIFSDLHRDADSDDNGRFEFGSIDHFKANARLYCRVLDYADRHKYTVLEAGDCEELWFIRDVEGYRGKGGTGFVSKLREIVNTYNKDASRDAPDINVYGRLRALHRDCRYFRLYGNHDSFLRPTYKDLLNNVKSDPAAFDVLRNEFEKDRQERDPRFTIYDAFVIPGVKTMLDHSGWDLLKDLWAARKKFTTEHLKAIATGRLGLDANDYKTKCPMLITHGHQFDFWNCDENQLLGLMISNTVATFVDGAMDPFLDLRGVALQGNPLFEFQDLFAALPVFNSWVSEQAAVRDAHRIQHMDNRDRQLSDGIMFKESIATLVGTFGLALDSEMRSTGTPCQPGRVARTAMAFRPDKLKARSNDSIAERVARYHGHHICIGHTHTPHSQPFMTLGAIGAVVPPLAPLTSALRALIPDLIEPMLKTRYFNSGTGGWLEGVIWAIEIDDSGQARLVYWTANSKKPERMDWELEPLPRLTKHAIDRGLNGALPALRGAMPDVGSFIRELERRLAEFKITPEEMKTLIYERLVIPIDAIALALSREAAELKQHVEQVLQEITAAGEAADEMLKQQWDKVRTFFTDVILTAKQRSLSGGVQPMERFAIRAPVRANARRLLERLRGLYISQGYPRDASLHYAATAMSALDRFPRNSPTTGKRIRGPRTASAAAVLFDTESPALHALVSMLWMFPPSGTAATIAGDELKSHLELTADELRLTVTIAPWAPEVPAASVSERPSV